MLALYRNLKYWVMLQERHLAQAKACTDACYQAYLRIPRGRMIEYSKTEQIQIELESLGIVETQECKRMKNRFLPPEVTKFKKLYPVTMTPVLCKMFCLSESQLRSRAKYYGVRKTAELIKQAKSLARTGKKHSHSSQASARRRNCRAGNGRSLHHNSDRHQGNHTARLRHDNRASDEIAMLDTENTGMKIHERTHSTGYCRQA
ncbi:MAG: hypothetical protein IPK44_03050 [Candidatus Accumulibacter sp.]|uniref:hypothetical protein n=1 Tax=Accumulibacter sp. TaxID=2053492 RepID=UPI0025863C41|nr:hypothetical protein [Accumulibacter sp.]MBK8113578.1 hypothetical protein [Accumulibacter sp.]